MATNEKKKICAFCKKAEEETGPIILGPDGVNICCNCVEICSNILDSMLEDEKNASGAAGLSLGNLPKPSEMKKMLDNYVTVEGKFTIVLKTVVQDGRYMFSTHNN